MASTRTLSITSPLLFYAILVVITRVIGSGMTPANSEPPKASLELLYEINRELTSALEMRTVLERVLFLSMRHVGATSGSIIVLDDNGRPVESAIITGDQVMKNTTQQLRVTLDRGLAGWVMRNRIAALVKNTNEDERWMVRQYQLEEKTEPKSAICAPILVRDRFVGVMTLVHPQAGFFNEVLLNFFQVIADQSGIAILNARLYAESQRQAHVMTALAETAATITGSLNTEDVLMRIMEQTSQALNAQAVSLALLDSSSNGLFIRAATGWKKNVTRTRIRPGQGVAGWVAKEGRGVIINDVNKDPRFDPETNERTGLRTQAIACAPMRYRGQVIGVLEALNTLSGGSFDSDALVVLSGIGSLAGTAVRHAQLFERLQAAHQSYRELFEASIDPILITDGQGKIKEVNRPAMLISDYDKDDLLQMSIGQLHVLDTSLLGGQSPDGKQFTNLKAGETISYESRLRTRSGHEVPIQAYVREVIIEGSSHYQWILRDITERKNLDNMREDLMSMIYHDLRSPLANVVSSLDTLESMLPEEDPTLHSLLAIAMRSVERIQRLTNSLLDLNRLEAGQPLGQQQANDISQIIEDAALLVRPVAESKGMTVKTDLPVDLPLVSIDGEMIRRVVTNLIENAVKYCPGNSRIVAGARVTGEMVEVWVQDDGPGIPSSEHERIFNKFTRLSSREKSKGLGLGLAYCKLAVQAHGGHIWVESEPGNGSRFAFTLPIDGHSSNL